MVRIENDFRGKKRGKIRFELTMISAENKEEKYGQNRQCFLRQIKKKNTIRIYISTAKKEEKVRFESTIIFAANKEEKYFYNLQRFLRQIKKKDNMFKTTL